MYKATMRALLRHSIERLNRGDYSLLLAIAHPDFELAFPGQNSWATMFRPQQPGRTRHVTHRGLDEATAFAERFVDEGIQFVIEDILVNGPPWNTRIAMRVHDYIPAASGEGDAYENRAVTFLELRWGRLLRWEDYEDTERIAAFDAVRASTRAPAPAPGERSEDE